MNYKGEKLIVSYNKHQKDFLIHFPNIADGHLIQQHICGDVLRWTGVLGSTSNNYESFNLIEELEKRGYDTKTLKFSCELKKDLVESKK